MLLAIDPGNDTGWALFVSTGELVACGLNNPPTNIPPDSLIIERPRVYPGTPPGKANDLITLAIGVGKYLERFSYAVTTVVFPHEWKGNPPKPIHHLRIWSKLSVEERTNAELSFGGMNKYIKQCEDYTEGVRKQKTPTSVHNNVMDAIGLGLYALNRLRP